MVHELFSVIIYKQTAMLWLVFYFSWLYLLLFATRVLLFRDGHESKEGLEKADRSYWFQCLAEFGQLFDVYVNHVVADT